MLLHPTSLPGEWGIGTLGTEACAFARWVADSGMGVWQVLPLSPPVYGYSPYQALSSFAGNPLLISPEELFQQGFLTSSELDSTKCRPSALINSRMRSQRYSLLGTAADRALQIGIAEFEDFMQLPWVQEWSWFAAEKEMNKEKPWIQWKNTGPVATDSLRVHGMIQFFFNTQWMKLKKYCNSLGIRILGDIPIYSAHDSTDVFFNRDLFKLDTDGNPAAVAGVPPDYFSRTGQLWGNPVYDWDQCARSGYRLWTKKMVRALNLYDAVRIDHFRAFDMYWEIPAGEATAVNGKWITGPGIELFRRMESSLGRLPVVAEDLGLVSPSVHALRKQCGFPGMVVLQFALQNSDFSIDSIDSSSVIYTGTHDNNTTAGWIKASGTGLGFSSVRSVIDLALSSPADLAVIPMQDILGLDSSARMNTPASPAGNWRWRMIEVPRSAGSFARR